MYIKDILYEENIVKNNNNKGEIIKEKVETGLGYYQSTAHRPLNCSTVAVTIYYKLIAESIQYTD